jgi:hypothetical protein
MAAMPFAPTPTDTLKARQASSRQWQHLADHTSVSLEQLLAAHASIHAVAEQISGRPIDSQKRAVIYYSIYEDSAGNFMFPLVATHGSLWGVKHTVRLERVLNKIRRASRHGTIARWIDALDMVRDINRRVFVEIYTTFYFTRFYGQHPKAGEIIEPEVLKLYNRVHTAIASDTPLTLEERREVYYNVFVHEQNDIVDPGIQEAAEASGSPWLVKTLKYVSPRFAFFPRQERLFFTDFTHIDQRNAQGLRALAFAEEVGAARVLEAMGEY